MWINSAAKNVLTYCLDLHNIIIYKFVKKITVPTSVLFGVILNHKSTAKLTPTVNYKHIWKCFYLVRIWIVWLFKKVCYILNEQIQISPSVGPVIEITYIYYR